VSRRVKALVGCGDAHRGNAGWAAARLRYVAGTKSDLKKYMNMDRLWGIEAQMKLEAAMAG